MKYVPFPSVESHGSPRQNLCSAVLKLSPGALIEAQLPPLVNGEQQCPFPWKLMKIQCQHRKRAVVELHTSENSREVIHFT